MPRSEERRVGKEWRLVSDWSSDVCSSDLHHLVVWPEIGLAAGEISRREVRLALNYSGLGSCFARLSLEGDTLEKSPVATHGGQVGRSVDCHNRGICRDRKSVV